MELDLQVSPEEIMSRKVELGCESWTFFASSCSSTAVQRTLSLRLCPARLLKQQLRSALVAAQWRGDTALTLPLFWRQSTVSPVFFGPYPRSSLHYFVLSRSPPPLPVPNKQPRFCGCKAKWLVGRSVGYALSVPNKPPRFCGRKAKWSFLPSVACALVQHAAVAVTSSNFRLTKSLYSNGLILEKYISILMPQ